MPNNTDLLVRLTTEVTESLDMGKYAQAWQGQTLSIVLNPPCIIDELAGKAFADLTRSQIVSVVSIFTGSEHDRIAKLDDALLYWLYGEALGMYNAYHDKLRLKN